MGRTRDVSKILTANTSLLSLASASATYRRLDTADSFKNKIINGNFDVWQRASSVTNWGNVGYPTADRWWINLSAISTSTVSRQSFTTGQTDVPNNPTYFMRVDCTSTGNFSYLVQKIENVTTFSGETATLSFWLRRNSGTATFRINLSQNFGSGGSTAVDTEIIGSTTPTSTWTKYTYTVNVPSVSGKTIGAANSLDLQIIISGALHQTDIAQIQFEKGSIATPFEVRPYTMELSLCRRYAIVFPNKEDFSSTAGDFLPMFTADQTTWGRGVINLPVMMRTAPTFSFASGSASNFVILGRGGSGSESITSLAIDTSLTTADAVLFNAGRSSMSTGQTFLLRFSGQQTARLLFSAEL